MADPANGQHWVGDSNQYYSTWWNAVITNEKAHWGSQSVKLGAQYQTVGYRFTGLQPGRNYAVQFYTWKPQDAAYYLEYAKITAGSTALWIDKDPKGSERVQNPAAVILAALPKAAGTGSWQRHTLSFKNGSETTATLWLKYGTKDYMYLDDLSIEAEALNYLPTFHSSLGTVTPENGVALRPGEQATFAAMPNLGGLLESDVYIDDITIEIAAPMVLNENVNTSFCEELYNYVENPSFESAATNSNWGSSLPKGFSIVSGSNALKGSHFMRLAAGSNHTFKFKVEPGKAYTFGISLRGSAGTKGQAALALMGSDGKYIHFSNLAGQTASVIQAKTNNEWVRSGFEVTPDDTGNIYLQLSCSAGTLDVGSVMLFESTYALRYDANDYTVYKNYDYNNLKSATALYNGGYGTQPYFRLSDSASQLEKSLWAAYETLQTGESSVLPAVCVLSATVAFAAALLLILKRKGGAAND